MVNIDDNATVRSYPAIPIIWDAVSLEKFIYETILLVVIALLLFCMFINAGVS